jgi:Peptidase family M28/PA domain
MKNNLISKNLLALFLILTFVFPSVAAAQTATKAKSAARKAAENITAKQMSDYLHFIASDEMEGRDTPSRGLDTTAKFIGMNLSRWNFKPAGDDGTFYQKISLIRELPDAQASSLTIGGETLKYGEDYFRLSGSSQTTISAPLVYGGDGWLIKSKGVDALRDVDVRGKIVVLYSSGLPSRSFATTFPKGVTAADLTGTRGTDWLDPLTNAKQKGAVGVIIVASDAAQKDWERLSKVFGGARAFVEKFRTVVSLPTVFLSQKAGDMLFVDAAKAPYRLAETNAPVFAASKNVGFIAAIKPERVYTQNVVAIWEGSDAVLKNEMVAVGAHYDHIGISQNSTNPDKINNGADDDGSGTTGILAIAEALAKSPKRPKRSVLFVWHCGEEKGLWGSEYFTRFPTIDLKNVVTQLNIDMIGRSRNPANIIPCDKTNKPCNDTISEANEVYVIGSEMLSSKLGAEVKAVNDAYLKLNYNFKYDDPTDKNRFYYRSDHFNYAKQGIPISFWFDGVHEDYHQPGDEAQKIDYNKMQMITRTIFLTMWELADLKERPKIDKQMSAERTQR